MLSPTTAAGLSLNDPLLLNVIETKCGLLDELYRCKVLNQHDLEIHQRKQLTTGNVRKLLKNIDRLSPEQQEQFLSALDRTGQSHVTNYIRNNGQRPNTDPDNWPVYHSEEYERVRQNWSKLIEIIDSRNGLLDELRSVNYINDREKQRLLHQPADDASNELLLVICQRRSVRDHKKFIDCLMKTKQHYAVWLLGSGHPDLLQPVSEEHTNTMTTNYSTLIQLMDIKASALTAKLLSDDVITWRQREYIDSATTQSESNSRLLDIIKRGSEQNYLKLIEYFNNNGQSHVANILCSNRVVTEILAQTNLSIAEEEYIVQQFGELYGHIPPQKWDPLRRKVFELLSVTPQDNQVIAMTTKHSITLYILCMSLTGLQYLNELYTTGHLKSILELILSVSLNHKGPLIVRSLKWDMSNYNKCVQYLSAVSGLTVYSKLHQISQQSQFITTDFVSHSLSINELPHELIELVLQKATGQLFVTFKKMVSGAHVVTTTTLHTVCLFWWETLKSRPTSRRLLIKHFNQSCFPYKFNPKLITGSMRLQQGRRVRGVAVLFAKLFIACSGSNTLKILSTVGSSYVDFGEEIALPELRWPTDVVACRVTNCLYISDFETRCIWQVSSSSSFQDVMTCRVKKFIVTAYEPDALSVQSGRLLVTTDEGTELFVYSCVDGKLIQTIKLPDYMLAYHAVETVNMTVIVCHGKRYIDEMNPEHGPSVSEVSKDGRVLRVHKRAVEFKAPYYVTIDSKNHVLVCDGLKKLIVHLNRNLELEHIVFAEELTGQPRRACYSEECGLLYVFHEDYDSDAFLVNVYRVNLKDRTNNLKVSS